MNRKDKNTKISKGYRLKPETHEKIYRIKNILNTSSDHAINKACEKLLDEIEKKIINNTITKEN